MKGTKEGIEEEIDIDDPHLLDVSMRTRKNSSWMRSKLLDGASAEFDQELVSKGELSPVFFGSALTNFGVETFLQHFLTMTMPPLPRTAELRRDRSGQRGFLCVCL